jgi:predicted esterase
MLRAFPPWVILAAAGCLVAPSSVKSGRAEGAAASARALPPLESTDPFVALPVPRHRAAVVSVPRGATSKRPVLVVAHGAGDRPEWQCQLWRGIVGDRAFILCPRGFPTDPYVPPEHTGYFFTTHHALAREIALGLAALRERFPEYADLEAPAFAGFSQGAIMGAMLLPSHPARFARAALIEGGYGLFEEWNIPVSERWRTRGGQRALLACGRDRCVEQARESAGHMRKGGIDVRVIHAVGAGHSYGGAMEREVRAAFPWVIEGDERWSAP